MSVRCPYCNHDVYLEYADGEGCEEGMHDCECPECEKEFQFRTAISIDHYPEKLELAKEPK